MEAVEGCGCTGVDALDADGTMEKRCKSKLWNPMTRYKKVPSRHTKCKTINSSQLYLYCVTRTYTQAPTTDKIQHQNIQRAIHV
eukprot:5578641-Ditylum_brightwellii.AAC.1